MTPELIKALRREGIAPSRELVVAMLRAGGFTFQNRDYGPAMATAAKCKVRELHRYARRDRRLVIAAFRAIDNGADRSSVHLAFAMARAAGARFRNGEGCKWLRGFPFTKPQSWPKVATLRQYRAA